MKKTIVIFLALTALGSCKQSSGGGPDEVSAKPKAAVTVTKIRFGTVSDNLQFPATTVYLKRNSVNAPIPGFITAVNIHLGEQVQKGDVIYEMESKERRAMGNAALKIDTGMNNFGKLLVRAPASGIVTTFDKQQAGDYVLEGALLCTIAEKNDLAFQINVPYEFSHYVSQGKLCNVLLPDNSLHNITITTPLTNMNVASQTQTILAKSADPLFLPENLIVKVVVSKGENSKKQVLPKSCILSDEMMRDFWVMKLYNDSIAVKVPVILGNKNDSEVEIINPKFNPEDRIIVTGNYGLSDTAWVNILKEAK